MFLIEYILSRMDWTIVILSSVVLATYMSWLIDLNSLQPYGLDDYAAFGMIMVLMKFMFLFTILLVVSFFVISISYFLLFLLWVIIF